MRGWIASVLGAVLVGAGCGASAAESRPNVVLVVVDTLRADRVGGPYGSRRGLTPFLDELGRRGTVFGNAYAPSSWTNPSVAALLTSRYPSQLHITGYDSKLSDAELTLAEILTAAGWTAWGFSANVFLSPVLGFAQGFDVWATWGQEGKVRGAQLRRRALRAIDQDWRPGASPPFFLFLQYFDPHSPYEPPQKVMRRLGLAVEPGVDPIEANRLLAAHELLSLSPAMLVSLERLYDAEVAYLDRQLRRLVEELDLRGMLANTILVVTSDHGEEFLEHNEVLHGQSLFNELIRVPLIMTGPGVPAGRVVTADVSLLDVAPTILALAGVASPPGFEGRSLVPFFTGAAPAREVVVEQPSPDSGLSLGKHTMGIVRGTTKALKLRDFGAVENAPPVLYDLAADPGEVTPNPPALAGERAAFGARMDEVARTLGARAGTAERGEIDAETRERLRALGYVF